MYIKLHFVTKLMCFQSNKINTNTHTHPHTLTHTHTHIYTILSIYHFTRIDYTPKDILKTLHRIYFPQNLLALVKTICLNSKVNKNR